MACCCARWNCLAVKCLLSVLQWHSAQDADSAFDQILVTALQASSSIVWYLHHTCNDSRKFSCASSWTGLKLQPSERTLPSKTASLPCETCCNKRRTKKEALRSSRRFPEPQASPANRTQSNFGFEAASWLANWSNLPLECKSLKMANTGPKPFSCSSRCLRPDWSETIHAPHSTKCCTPPGFTSSALASTCTVSASSLLLILVLEVLAWATWIPTALAACGQASGPAASGGPPLDSRALGVLETFLGSLLLAGSIGAGLTLVVVPRLGGASVLGALGTTASTARPITHVWPRWSSRSISLWR